MAHTSWMAAIAIALGGCLAEADDASPDDVRSAVVPTPDGLRRLTFRVVDGVPLHEGDIALPPEVLTGQLDKAAAVVGRRWPDARVPFVIEDESLRVRVEAAVAEFERRTPVRLVPRAGEADYVAFVASDRCWSWIGRAGGRQVIELGPGCTTGVTIHEIGHAIGLWHEQSRRDRDRFVRIHRENIEPGEEYNFDPYRSGEDLGAYDFDSIMHYSSREFSGNGRPTITRLDGSLISANRTALSTGDRHAIQYMYGAFMGAGTWYRANDFCTHAGARLYYGDFNGDHVADRLCHDPRTLWIDYAEGGVYGNVDWWVDDARCTERGSQLLVGNFGGDHRADLMCRRADGTVWVDIASPSGRFEGADWSGRPNFCIHDGARVFQGDFNGDRLDDLLCHDSERMWIDLAVPAGRFEGHDWFRSARFCTHPTAEIRVGKFDADRTSDLMCRDASGEIWIDYAARSVAFEGPQWARDADFCTHEGSQLLLGDVTGDGRDDLVCHDTRTGAMWIDYASRRGEFWGTDWSRDAAWCRDDGDEVVIGQFSRDARADLMCRDRRNLWVTYSGLSAD